MEAREQQPATAETITIHPQPEDFDGTVVTIPGLEVAPAQLAEFWLQRGIVITEVLRSIKARLTQYLLEGQSLPGLSLTWSYEYPPDAAAEFPDLVTRRAVTATVGTEQEFQQIVEFLAEFVPEAENKFDLKIDGRRANQLILHGGNGGDRLKALRSETPRLVVKT
jgi:hypothetical protein